MGDELHAVNLLWLLISLALVLPLPSCVIDPSAPPGGRDPQLPSDSDEQPPFSAYLW